MFTSFVTPPEVLVKVYPIDISPWGSEVAVPVAVAGVGALVGALTVAGAAQRVGLGTHQGMNEHRQQLTRQVGARSGESVGQDLLQVDIVGSGHRVL